MRNRPIIRLAPPLLAVVLGACARADPAGGTPDTPTPEPDHSRAADAVPAVGTAAVASEEGVTCGGPFTAPTAGPLTLTARFPATAAGGEALSGAVDITSATAFRGVGPAEPDVFLVADGTVVTLPATQDSVGLLVSLSAGRTTTLPARAVLTPCARDVPALEPRVYELFVRFVVTPDDGGPLASFGGPWLLRVV